MKRFLLIALITTIMVGAVAFFTTSASEAPTEPGATEPIEPTELPTEAAEEVTFPVIESIVPDSTGFTIRWSAYGDAAKYRLFYRGAKGWIGVGDTAGTTLRHPNLKDGTTFTYTVRGLDADGRYVTDFNRAGWTMTYRSGPVLTAAAASGNAMKITWQKLAEDASYRVYRKEGATWVGIGFSDTDSFIDENVVSGRSYTYTVRAYEPDRVTMITGFQPAGKTGAFVSMPVITNIEALNTGVRITWGKVDGAASYRVFVRAAVGWRAIGTVSGLTYTYQIAPNGTATAYTVRALNASGEYVSDFLRDNKTHTYLPMPKLTALTNVWGGQKLMWDRVPGAQRYRIYIKNGSSWQKYADTTALSCGFTGLKNQASYTYTVRCLGADGRAFLSGFSASGLTTRYYESPVITGVENLRDGARVTWKAVAGVSRYRVFIKNGASWKALANVSGTVYDHKDAVQGVTYIYTVRAIDASGNFISGFSPDGYSNRYQTAPLLTGVRASDEGAVLTWDEYEGIHSYRVFRHVIGTSWGRIADVNGTAYTDTAAPAGLPCQYTLRGLDENGKLITDYVDNGLYYVEGALADGTINVNGYLCTFSKGKLTKGYVTVQDIIRIARAEVGYQAKNYRRCKYNTWYYGAEVSGEDYHWCVVFMEWVFNQANARSLLFEKTAGAEIFGSYFYQHGQLVKSGYRVGDLILIHWNEGYSDWVPGVKKLNHVGLVISVNGDGTYTTIEGNTGDNPNGEVCIKVRRADQISAAARPKYGFYIPA